MGHIHHRHVHPQHVEAENVEKRAVDGWVEDEGVATIMNVVYETLTKTFDGPAVYLTPGNPTPTAKVGAADTHEDGSAILGPPVQGTPTTTPNLPTNVGVPTTRHTELDPHPPSSSSISLETTPFPKSTPKATTTQKIHTTSTKTNQHTTMVKSTSKTSKTVKPSKTSSKPKPTQNHAVVADKVKPSSSSVDSANSTSAITSTSSDDSGMSGGAVAGLAIGLILGLIAIIAAVFIIYRRKKKTAGMQKLDDEKSYNEKTPIVAAPAPTYTPSMRSTENAPRLSVRAVSQFSPTFGGNQDGKPQMTQNGRLAPSAAPISAWEKRGAQNDPTNPFGEHAEKSHSPEPPRELKADSWAIVGGAVPDSGRVSPPEHKDPPHSPTAPSVRSSSSGASINSGFTEASEAPSAIVGGAAAGAPGGPAPPPSNVHRIQMDFKPTMDDELEVRAGQLVRILHNYDDGWALCIRMDRSQQGVVPRSCLSKHPLKPRQPGRPRGPPPGARGPPPPFAAQPRPLSPGGRNSPGPHGRSMSPAGGRGSPAPFAGPGPRPQSPLGGPRGPPRGPGPRPRAGTAGGPPRSMSPGPYGPGAQRPDQPAMRRRSNSVGDMSQRRQSPPSGPSPLNPSMPARKPVPGQAM